MTLGRIGSAPAEGRRKSRHEGVEGKPHSCHAATPPSTLLPVPLTVKPFYASPSSGPKRVFHGDHLPNPNAKDLSPGNAAEVRQGYCRYRHG